MKSIVEEIFGSKVFDESVMREKLAKDTYRELEKNHSRWKTVKYQNRKRGSPRYERMGLRTRCNTLYTLVPANDRSYS